MLSDEMNRLYGLHFSKPHDHHLSNEYWLGGKTNVLPESDAFTLGDLTGKGNFNYSKGDIM